MIFWQFASAEGFVYIFMLVYFERESDFRPNFDFPFEHLIKAV